MSQMFIYIHDLGYGCATPAVVLRHIRGSCFACAPHSLAGVTWTVSETSRTSLTDFDTGWHLHENFGDVEVAIWKAIAMMAGIHQNGSQCDLRVMAVCGHVRQGGRHRQTRLVYRHREVH